MKNTPPPSSTSACPPFVIDLVLLMITGCVIAGAAWSGWHGASTPPPVKPSTIQQEVLPTPPLVAVASRPRSEGR